MFLVLFKVRLIKEKLLLDILDFEFIKLIIFFWSGIVDLFLEWDGIVDWFFGWGCTVELVDLVDWEVIFVFV